MGEYDQNMLYEMFEELIKARIILCTVLEQIYIFKNDLTRMKITYLTTVE